MAKKKITLREPKKDNVVAVAAPASVDDAASAVAAPGLEEFKTPDVSKPATAANVSESASDRFSEGNVDWNQALEDADNEPNDNFPEIEETVPVSEEVVPAAVTATDDETPPEPVVALEVDPSEAIVAPAEEPVIEGDDFQPAVDVDPQEPLTQVELDKDYTEKREAAVSQVMERYQLTEEQRDQVLTNPEEFLPRLAAQVFVDVYESVLGAVGHMLPERVSNINAEFAANQEKTKAFFDKWPALKTDKGVNEVTRIGKVYRNLNQDASSKDFITNVGIQASLALGLELPGVTAEEPAPVAETPAFQPAGSGSVSETVPVVDDPRKSSNQFERMNASWDD